MLAPQSPHHPDGSGFEVETVASMVNRLGPPPPRCGDRFRVAAGDLGHDPTAGWNDPQWTQLVIDHQGFLMPAAGAGEASIAAEQSTRFAATEHPTRLQPPRRRDKPTRRVLLVGIAAVVAIGLIGWFSRTPRRTPSATQNDVDRPGVASTPKSPGLASTAEPAASVNLFDPSVTLETIASTEVIGEDGEPASDSSRDPIDGIDLADLIPMSTGPKSPAGGTDDLQHTVDPRRPGDADADSNDDDLGDMLTDLDDDDEVLEVSAQTVTEAGGTLELRLPDRPSRSDPASPARPPPTIETATATGWPADDRPTAVSFSLANQLSGELAADSVRVFAGQAPVASLTAGRGGWTFTWLDAAATRGESALMPHGRIDTAAGRHIYLRPQLVAEPVTLPVTARDTTLRWDLGTPPPPRVSRLGLHFNLPGDVDVGWIKPIDPAAVRKQTALAVLSPAEDEDVRLAMRLDITATTRLNVRVRWGLRIDSSMPWVWGDAGTVNTSLSQLTAIEPRLAAAVPQIEQQMDVLKSAGRRKPWEALDARLVRIKAALPQAKLAADRYRRLDAMMLQLEAATMTVDLTVQWPDGVVQHLIQTPGT